MQSSSSSSDECWVGRYGIQSMALVAIAGGVIEYGTANASWDVSRRLPKGNTIQRTVDRELCLFDFAHTEQSRSLLPLLVVFSRLFCKQRPTIKLGSSVLSFFTRLPHFVCHAYHTPAPSTYLFFLFFVFCFAHISLQPPAPPPLTLFFNPPL